jgi:vitamin B12 transporter
MKKILGFSSVVICIFCLSFTVAWAEGPQEGTESYTLGEVVVKAERTVVESVGTVREITQEDIRNKGARTLDEALQLLPGVIIRTGADGVPRVDMRGFRSRHVILLLDGVPLNSTADGQFDPSIIPTEDIALIKVSYGDHSLLYGDGGLGGVINIITKKGKKGLHGMASGEGGQGDSYLGRFNLSGGSQTTNFFTSGDAYHRNGFRLSSDFEPTSEQSNGIRDNSDKRRDNFFGNLTFTTNDKLSIGGVFNYFNGNYGIPPSTINDPSNPFADKPKYERIDNQQGYTGNLSASYDLPGPWGLRSWVFFNQLREEDNRYDNNHYDSMENKDSSHLIYRSRILGGALQTACDLKSAGMITLGLNGRQESLETEGKVRDVASGGGGGGGGGGSATTYDFRNVDDDNHIQIYSATLQYDWIPIKKLGTVLSYSHNWLSKEGGEDDNEGAFLVGAYYDILENTRIRGSFARQIRFPTIRQLYEEGDGNPDLKTERSYNSELGVEQRLPLNSMVTLTSFYIDVKDYIEKSEVTDRFENNDKYRFTGFELTGETRFVKNLFLRTGYSFLNTEDRSPGTEKDELQYRPRHKLTFEGKYDFSWGFSVYANVIYVADQVFYSKKAPLLKKSLNDYTVANIKLVQALLDGRINIYLGIDNLFDENYEQSYGLPQPGRFVYGGVTVYL